MIEVVWRPLLESERGVTFVVSPSSGELLAFEPADLQANALEDWRRRERLVEAARAESLATHDLEQGYLGQARRKRAWPAALMLRIAWLCAEFLARFAPLERSFRTIERFASHLPAQRFSVEEVLDAAAFAERSFYSAARTQRCLPRTLLRFFLFRLGRYPIEASIGLWVPTEMMHAWVSLGGVPLGEEREEVMHYQACLRFATSGPA